MWLSQIESKCYERRNGAEIIQTMKVTGTNLNGIINSCT